MKSASILAIATALMLSASTAAYAQTATTATDTATDAAAGAAAAATGSAAGTDASGTAGATAGSTTGTSTSTDNGSMSGSGSTSLTLDANADGSIDADEIAAANTSLSTQTGTTVNIDADGDGTLSDDEIAAANEMAGMNAMAEDSVTCGDSGIEATISGMGELDMAMLASASNVRVVLVSDCDTADVTSALASEGATSLRTELGNNSAAVAAIQSRGATVADVLGATSSGDTLTVYVADESTGS
jgi:hypothetical protein